MGIFLIEAKTIRILKGTIKTQKQKNEAVKKYKSQNQGILIAMQHPKGFDLQIKPKANNDPDQQKSKPNQSQNQG